MILPSPLSAALLGSLGSAITILPLPSTEAVRRLSVITLPACLFISVVLTVLANTTPVFKEGARVALASLVTLIYAARKSMPVAVLICPWISILALASTSQLLAAIAAAAASGSRLSSAFLNFLPEVIMVREPALITPVEPTTIPLGLRK